MLLSNASDHLTLLAYLDPGTGSFILQILIAGSLGLIFAIKRFWAQIKAFLKLGTQPDPEEQDRDDQG